jgi:hypothetical protein
MTASVARRQDVIGVCPRPAGRLTSRLRQRSIAAQAAGPGGNEVKVGARHMRERPRNSYPPRRAAHHAGRRSTALPSRRGGLAKG